MNKAEAIKKLAELLKDFDDPMESRVVKTDEEFSAAVAEMVGRGKLLAATSNAGLPDGMTRLTFLPKDAFRSEPY